MPFYIFILSAGEEINISYTEFFSLNSKIKKQFHKVQLNIAWNIVCPPNCACDNDDLWRETEIGGSLDEQILYFGIQRQPEQALRAAKELLQFYDEEVN